MHHVKRAASNVNSWGSWAARRYIMRQCGYNEATAIRCLQAAKLCMAMEKYGL